MILKITSLRMISDLATDPNWVIRMKKIATNGNNHCFQKESHGFGLIVLLTGQLDGSTLMQRECPWLHAR